MAFPASEQRIAEAEARLGRRLPATFRARLARDNGGEIEMDDDCWCVHPVWDSTDRKTMGRTANHIVAETEAARTWQSFPADGIALASDGCGNFIIVRRDSEELYRWDHETGECDPFPILWE